MKFKNAIADEAYREILADVGRVVADLESEWRRIELPTEARVHIRIEAARLRIHGLQAAISTAANIEQQIQSMVIGAQMALHGQG